MLLRAARFEPVKDFPFGAPPAGFEHHRVAEAVERAEFGTGQICTAAGAVAVSRYFYTTRAPMAWPMRTGGWSSRATAWLPGEDLGPDQAGTAMPRTTAGRRPMVSYQRFTFG